MTLPPLKSFNKHDSGDIPWCTKINCGGKPVTSRCCYPVWIAGAFTFSLLSLCLGLAAQSSAFFIVEHLGGNATQVWERNSSITRYEQREYLMRESSIAPLCEKVAVGSEVKYARYAPDTTETVYKKECSKLPNITSFFDISLIPGVESKEGKEETFALLIIAILCSFATLLLNVQILQCRQAPNPKVSCIPVGSCCCCCCCHPSSRLKKSSLLLLSPTRAWIFTLLLNVFSMSFYFAAVGRFHDRVSAPAQDAFLAASSDDVVWDAYVTSHNSTTTSSSSSDSNISFFSSLRQELSTSYFRDGGGYSSAVAAGSLFVVAFLLLLTAGLLGRKWLFCVRAHEELTEEEK